MQPGEAHPPALDQRLESEAEASFETALRLCVDCAEYHAVRPYLRAGRTVSGIANDWDAMEPRLAALIAGGRRRILVAGSGDSGVATLVMTAARGLPVALTVMDRCATPLVQLHRLAARHGLRIDTRQDDLTSFDLPDAFDLVVAHHVLQFLPGGEIAMLRRVERSLAPGGRLFLASREAAWRSWRDSRFGRPGDDWVKGYIAFALERMQARGVPPPRRHRADFDRLLAAHARQRLGRGQLYGEHSGLAAQLQAAQLEELWSVALESNGYGEGQTSPEARPARSGMLLLAGRRGEHDAER